MTATYTNGVISITKNLIFGWSILTVADDNVEGWVPLDNLDKPALQFIIENLSNPVFSAEALQSAQSAMDKFKPDVELIKEYKITVINSDENWDLINSAEVSWGVEAENSDTMIAMFFSEEDYNKAKEVLKRSSKAYPY